MVEFERKIKPYRSVPKLVRYLLGKELFSAEEKRKKKTPIGDIDLPSTIVQLRVEMLSTLVNFKKIMEILYHVFSSL